MNKAGESKVFYIVVSLLISFALWVYVVSVVNPGAEAELRNLPVVIQGQDILESRGLVITAVSRQEVNLHLLGNRMALGAINAQNTSIILDVTSITEEGTWTLKYRATLPSTVTSGAVSIPSEKNDFNIAVTVAKRAGKTVEIRGEFTGSVAEGYQVAPVVVSPDTVNISGQEDHVNQVAYGRVEVVQQNLSQTYTGEMAYELYNADGERLYALNITRSVDTVHVSVPVVQVRELPLMVRILPGGGATEEDVSVTITPASISVSGEPEDLEALKELDLGAIDLSKILNTETFTFDIFLPSGLTSESGVTQAKVTVKVEGLSSKLMEIENIEIINVPDGFEAELVTQSLQVVVRGSTDALGMVLTHQLRAVADLSEISMSVGQVRVPVKVYLDGGSGAGIVGNDYSISIMVSRR